jgi:hypothetical protein
MRPETPDDRVIDATGKFILPGLIDAHCHISLHQGALPGVRYTSTAEFCSLWAAYAIGRVLRAGVTSIAAPGGKWFTDVTVREAVEGGLLEGPRMVVAGRALSNYGGIFDPDPYPAFEGTPADTAGILCNARDDFILRPADNASVVSIARMKPPRPTGAWPASDETSKPLPIWRRSTRRISSGSRMDFGRGAASMTRWMR